MRLAESFHTIFVVGTVMTGETQNCTWAFSFQCPQKWSALTPTDDPEVRTCGVCLKRVFRCVTGEQIAQRGAQGQCVAIFPAESTQDEDDDGGLLGALVRVEDI